jgi:hypothetical protein
MKSSPYALAGFALTVTLSLCAAAPPLALHVATNGSDNWSGKLSGANASKTDGPFATVERARDALRNLKTQQGGKLKQPVTVFVHGGTYRLTRTLQFAPEDSGTPDCPITYSAFENERPILSGGRTIGGFKEVTVDGKHLWAVEIPEVREGKWYFHQLWVNGERRQRARNPNQGFFRVTAVPGLTSKTNSKSGQNRFQFAPGEVKPYDNIEDVEAVLIIQWLAPHIGIAKVDTAANLVTLSHPSPRKMTDGLNMKALSRYYIENAFELLDSPGEWYLNRKTGTLYYMPMPGESIATTAVVAPALEYLMRVEGDRKENRYVEHLTFRGLSFEHAEWWAPRDDPDTKFQRQGTVYAPAAIQLVAARQCSFESCTVAHISQYAIDFARGSEHGRVVGCEMFDLGTGGVKIGDTYGKEPVHHIEVTDNHIHHGGLTFPSSHAVWIGLSGNNLVAHNHIHDFYYIAISSGWDWHYGPPRAHDNIIEYNHIHDIGKGWLNDLGAIYTLGVQPGTMIRYNLMHDIECVDYAGSGIYFDMASSGIIAEKNIVYRTTTGGLHQNFGKDNIVRNNIFVLGKRSQLDIGPPKGSPSQNTFERNVIYWPRDAKFLEFPWRDIPIFVPRKNLYWHDGVEPKFGKLTWKEWQARGLDEGTMIADPMFVDPAKDDFRLKPDSPAFKLGFEPFDLSEVGPRPPYRVANAH